MWAVGKRGSTCIRARAPLSTHPLLRSLPRQQQPPATGTAFTTATTTQSRAAGFAFSNPPLPSISTLTPTSAGFSRLTARRAASTAPAARRSLKEQQEEEQLRIIAQLQQLEDERREKWDAEVKRVWQEIEPLNAFVNEQRQKLFRSATQEGQRKDDEEDSAAARNKSSSERRQRGNNDNNNNNKASNTAAAAAAATTEEEEMYPQALLRAHRVLADKSEALTDLIRKWIRYRQLRDLKPGACMCCCVEACQDVSFLSFHLFRYVRSKPKRERLTRPSLGPASSI